MKNLQAVVVANMFSLKKDVFSLFTSMGQRKNSESPCGQEESTSDLCILHSDALPLNLYSEQDHFEVIYDMHPAYCWDQQC